MRKEGSKETNGNSKGRRSLVAFVQEILFRIENKDGGRVTQNIKPKQIMHASRVFVLLYEGCHGAKSVPVALGGLQGTYGEQAGRITTFPKC